MEKDQIKKRIRQLLNINDEEYGMIMYETGEEYFEWRCNGFTGVLKAFRHSRVMWQWWKEQYFIIDEAICASEAHLTRDLYRALHLGIENYPDETIVTKAMDEYDRAVQTEIKKTKNGTAGNTMDDGGNSESQKGNRSIKQYQSGPQRATIQNCSGRR